MKQKLTELKGEMDSFPTVVEGFNTPPSIMISKEIEDLNNTIHQLYQTDYAQHSNIRIYIFLNCTWNNFLDRPYVRSQIKFQ